MKIGKKSFFLALFITALLQGSLFYHLFSSLIAQRTKKESEKQVYLIHPPNNAYRLHRALWLQLYRSSFDQEAKRLSLTSLQQIGIFSELAKEQNRDRVELRYRLREPKAILGDYANSLIAKDGVIMAFAPCYAFCQLPLVYLGPFLGGGNAIWNKRLDPPFWAAICALLERLDLAAQKCRCKLDAVDFSRMIAGPRSTSEIIVCFTSRQQKFSGEKCHIRIGLHGLEGSFLQEGALFKQIEQIAQLKGEIEKNWQNKKKQNKKEALTVLDLRIKGVAFIGY